MMLFINDPDMRRCQKAKCVGDLSRFKRAHKRLNDLYEAHEAKIKGYIEGFRKELLKHGVVGSFGSQA